jgi:hypothetical protein
VIYGEESKRRIWDGNGQEQEKVLREKHVEFLGEIIPKSVFSQIRREAKVMNQIQPDESRLILAVPTIPCV